MSRKRLAEIGQKYRALCIQT